MSKLSLREKLIIGVILVTFIGIFALVLAKLAGLFWLLIPLFLVSLVLAFFIIRNPEFGWYGLIFFLPFERVPSFNFAGANLKISTILGAFTLFAWFLALMFNPKKFKVQPNFLAIPLSLFTIVMLLSLVHAGDISRGIFVMIFILFAILLSILAVNMVETKEKLQTTLLVLFLTSFIVGVFGLFQFGGDVVGLPRSITLLKAGYDSRTFGFPRIQAFSAEPLYLANFLLIPLFVGFTLFVNKVNIFKNKFLSRWGLIILLALLLIDFILTVSRGAYVGFAVAFLVVAVLLFRKIFTWKNVLFFVLTVGIVGYGVAFALSRGDYRATNEFIGHVLLKDYNKGESIQGRFVTYKQGLLAYKESPVLGVGIGNYGPWALDFPTVKPNDIGWPIVNNEYIEILAETGIIGLISFSLILIFLAFRTFVALKYVRDAFLRSVLIGLFATAVGIFVQYNFFSTLYIAHIWITLGLLVGVQNVILKNRQIN